jgi:hypothetical protein
MYKWLVVSALYPPNQRYIIRYELLIYTLLSIPEKDFLNNELSRQKFEHFIKWFEKKYSQEFIMMEDWEPFEQTQLIPIFFEKKRYYFYYGASERPYEAIRQFQEILFTKHIEELQEVKKEFLLSLVNQTKILELMSKDSEANIKTEQMYIPTLKSLNKYFNLFKIYTINKNYLHSFKYDYEMGMNNFNGLYTEIDNEYFILPPQCHIETLYQITESFIYDGRPSILSHINDTFLNRSRKMITQFFDIRNMLDILVEPIMKSNAAEYFDSIVRIDADKILLFKNINHSEKSLLDDINTVANESIKELKKIIENPYLGLKYINEKIENANIVPPEILEFKIILIYEKLTLNYMMGFEENWKEKDVYIFNSMDIKPVFELLQEKETDTDISFIQYLEAEKQQSMQNTNPLIQMDALDSFAIYYKNESFLIAGQQPDFMMYAPHEWSDFYNKYIYSKYQDNIYELIEKKYPKQFNLVKHMSEDTYSFMDSAFIRGGRCIKFNNKLIWVMYPIGVNSTGIEVKTFEFLGQFISFYIDKYKKNLFKLLGKYGFSFDKVDFIIEINPDTLITRTPALNHLADTLSTLSLNKINFCTKQNPQSGSLHTFITYKADIESLAELFKMNIDQNPEKEIFKSFIVSLLKYFKEENKYVISREFIDTNWHIKERAFSFDTKVVDNARLEKYRTPKKFQDSFVSRVNQDIVTHLKELNVEPKEYWGKDAQELNNIIFDFLQNKLEKEISKFNQSVLFYTYTQIEYLEGQRESDETQAGLDSSKYIEFDINEKYNKQRMEVSHLTISAKHIAHTILKVNPKGGKSIVDTDWYFLSALSMIINETIGRSDHLYYSISETGVEITNMYEMIDIDKSSQIDFDGYYQQVTSSKIISAKNRFPKEQKASRNENPRKVDIFDKQLNEAWYKEYEFYLDDMVVVLNSLGRHDFERDIHFPLNLISFDKINDFLQEDIVEPPSTEEIKKILNFLSLDFSTFSKFNIIDYSLDRLMKKKERINLSPFIKIDDKYLFGNQLLLISTKAWYHPLIDGDIPFTISKDSLIKTEIDRIHNNLDIQLECDAYDIASDTLSKDYVRKNIDKFQTLCKTFPQKPPCGEIDLLVVNPETKTMFVMDAKNVNKKLFTSAISRELNKFVKGEKSYLVKLNKKFDFIQKNIDDILNHFKIEDRSDWKIKKGFVVNVLYLSAFYEEKVDFILLDDLATYICKEQGL